MKYQTCFRHFVNVLPWLSSVLSGFFSAALGFVWCPRLTFLSVAECELPDLSGSPSPSAGVWKKSMALDHFQTLTNGYFFKENIHSHRPDLLLDIFGKEVGSGLISSITAVSEDLISIHRKGPDAVLRRISALYHSPSLCAILNTQKTYYIITLHL